ncbi:tripartite motif-containing protein 16-like protein [Garra rufa]|uniref:tripartite motif-containing protein 16-like protein n=1 Tax=Garra rufa TaxID=137080 RepID=UPI003CCE94E4
MEEAKISVAEDQFSCPICLDLLKGPVTIPCGHSYCMNCITDCWNKEDQWRVYSCPECRQTFSPRPALNMNVMFAEMVEKLKKKKVQMKVEAQSFSYAEPGDVECDVCTGRKRKAVKACLMCLESYCQTHIECHKESHSSKRHKLTDAGRIHKMICSKHDRLQEIFCRTDQLCICLMCMMDEHKNHDTVSVEAEWTEKQNQVGELQEKCQRRIQERQKKLQELKEAIKTHKSSAQAAVKESERIFTELIRSIKRSRTEVIQMIRNQEQAEVSRAEGLLKQLEREIDDLRRRGAELEQLLHIDVQIHFLQSFQSLSKPLESTVVPRITVSSVLPYDDVRKSVSHLKEILEEFCKEKVERLSGQVTYINIISNNEPRTREEFLQYSRQLTLDPNTSHKQLHLSKDHRVATFTQTEQPYPDHPDRFDVWPQALCRERVCGRCYWEVEWSAGAGISVSYKSICRKGETKDCLFGYKNESWKLQCSQSSHLFFHNNIKTYLPMFPSTCRIGVYVDHRAGILSFYKVSDTMTLIHRVQTTFTQPLYPGFGVYGSTVKLCNLRE